LYSILPLLFDELKNLFKLMDSLQIFHQKDFACGDDHF